MLEFMIAKLPSPLCHTVALRLFGITKVPMIGKLRPRVITLSEDSLELVIPITRFSRNHLHSMYLGALVVGADCAGGYYAYHLIQKSQQPVSLVFKNLQATFLRRAHHDVYFQCTDGKRIQDLVQRALLSGEREDEVVTISAFTKTKEGEKHSRQEVASFSLTISLKKRGTN
ncbi:MAG: DUF4442 domain-containing protein [Bdellovibrionales bacterium]|nr:DUF4442 domain-containing protein [Bdellovibrionales bacterium]